MISDGDAVEVVNKAILTKDDPQADVLFGIDSNTLTKAFDADLFEPYDSPGLATVDSAYQLDPEHRVTPVDHGDVCLNYDKAWFADKGVAPPTSMDDLTAPDYKGDLSWSRTRRRRPRAWPSCWPPWPSTATTAGRPTGRSCAANGVSVVDGWEAAYYTSFSGSSGKGDKPIVVSVRHQPAVRGHRRRPAAQPRRPPR